MDVIVSIDPGVKKCGVAHWWADGTLMSAALVDTDYVSEYARHCELYIEFPQAYHSRTSQKGDQNDLLNLAAVIGSIEVSFHSRHRLFPREWKGQVPKNIMCKRVQSKLKPEELQRVQLPTPSLRHNVWDAIGIGLYVLGRL